MKSLAYCFTLLSIIAMTMAASQPAQAQRARVFVSIHGNDSNPCTALSPCKTFQAAHDAVLAGGEISVLDTGGYGTLVISKSISIVAVGVEASIAVPSGGTGITINAGASDAINLRGLIVDGAGIGPTGIVLNQAQSLMIDNCVVRNLTSSGIALGPIFSSTIIVSDTVVADNGGHGIYLQPNASGQLDAYAVFNRVQALRNGGMGIGLFANNGLPSIDAIAVDSVSAFNQGDGFYALGGGNGAAFRIFHAATFENAGWGVKADGHSFIYVSQSNLGDGWTADNGGSLQSYGDNYVDSPAPGGTLSRH